MQWLGVRRRRTYMSLYAEACTPSSLRRWLNAGWEDDYKLSSASHSGAAVEEITTEASGVMSLFMLMGNSMASAKRMPMNPQSEGPHLHRPIHSFVVMDILHYIVTW